METYLPYRTGKSRVAQSAGDVNCTPPQNWPTLSFPLQVCTHPKLSVAPKTAHRTSPLGLKASGLQLLLSQVSMDQSPKNSISLCPVLALLRCEEDDGAQKFFLPIQKQVGDSRFPYACPG